MSVMTAWTAAVIEDPECVAKTFPDFFDRLQALS